MKAPFFIFIVAISFFSCTNSKNSKVPIARVGDVYLYLSDLGIEVNDNITSRDSAEFVRNYANSWAKQQLKLQKAEFNLKSEDIDIAKQVEDYKNSLIIYAYETRLIEQNIDTIFTDTEIEQYYNANKSNFELKNNIVKLRFAKTSNPKAVQIIKKYLKTTNENELIKLENYAKKNQVNLYLNDTVWLLFDDVLKEIPINTYNQESFLKNNRYIETKDQNMYYFVYIVDLKIKESISPLEYEKTKIKNILLNKRKIRFLEKMEEQLYNEALKKGKLEIYDKL